MAGEQNLIEHHDNNNGTTKGMGPNETSESLWKPAKQGTPSRNALEPLGKRKKEPTLGEKAHEILSTLWGIQLRAANRLFRKLKKKHWAALGYPRNARRSG